MPKRNYKIKYLSTFLKRTPKFLVQIEKRCKKKLTRRKVYIVNISILNIKWEYINDGWLYTVVFFLRHIRSWFEILECTLFKVSPSTLLVMEVLFSVCV